MEVEYTAWSGLGSRMHLKQPAAAQRASIFY